MENSDVEQWELDYYEICHNPALWQMFLTPVNDRATDTLAFQTWLEEDHWGKVRPYQIPELAWDHILPSAVPIDAAARPGYRGIDRKALGDAHIYGGRKMSKSFSLTHDVLQSAVIREGEQTLVTSRDENHLQQRIDALKEYLEYHPLISRLALKSTLTNPYASIVWYNGHVTLGIYESTSGEGTNYEGQHFHRKQIDEFQMTGAIAWKKLIGSESEDGCVVRTIGVSDGRRDTPASIIRNDPRKAKTVYKTPQYLRENWTPAIQQREIEAYGGADSLEYETNVEAKEGERSSGVWSMEDIHACMETLPDDKDKKVAERRKIKCPILTLTGEELKSREVSEIEFPRIREADKVVWISMDVGKAMHPSVIGIWGMEVTPGGTLFPRQWGKIILWRVDYSEQAKFIIRLLKRYSCIKFGLDTTAADGRAIVEYLVKLKEKETLEFEIIPVDMREVIELEDPILAIERRNEMAEHKERKKKQGIKYFITQNLLRRFGERQISIFYDQVAELEFESEVATAAMGPSPEKYHGPQGDHTIDMFRILEYMVYKSSEIKKGVKRLIYNGIVKAIKLGRL